MAGPNLPTNRTTASTVNEHVLDHNKAHAVLNALETFSGVPTALGWKLPEDFGLDTTGTTVHTAAEVQTWLDSGVVYGSGLLKVSGPVVIKYDADLHLLEWQYTGTTGTAIRVGVTGTPTFRKSVRLPYVKAVAKTMNGWAQVAGTIGIELYNCINVNVDVPYVQGFETNVQWTGNGAGTAYCNVIMGHLDNGKRNERWVADATGYVNQNNIFGGRFSHNSNEGTIVSGTRHVLMESAASRINNNTHWGSSFESPNTVEYHWDCAGNDNYMENCRWENTGEGARVAYRANAVGNAIRNGFGSSTLQYTTETGSANHHYSRDRSYMVGNGAGSGHAVLALENWLGSTSPALRIMDAGAQAGAANQNTAWCVDVSAQKIRGKRPADAFERINLEQLNGRIYLGDGTAAPAHYFSASPNAMLLSPSSSLWPLTTNTADLGQNSLKWRYVRAGTAVQTGTFTTAARPAAATAGAGAMIFDTTLNKPVWSTGSAWVDATGATV